MAYLKYLLIVTFFPLLIGCRYFEPTTVKGHWKSNTFKNGKYCDIKIDDDKYTISLKNDEETFHQMNGTWVIVKDTLSLFEQDEGSVSFVVQKLSTNTMTIQKKNEKECLILTRVCDNHGNSFTEALSLKFPYLIPFVEFIVVCCMLGYVLWFVGHLLEEIYEGLMALFRKKRKKQ
ncbi:MAG: hypothetical protein ACOCNU_01920 [Bacteroidales bacterium]